MSDSTQEYEKALQHLDQLQAQLDTLRSTVPSLVAPLIKPQNSKAQMFAEIKKSATTSTTHLASFRESWSSEQTQQLLAKAHESEKNDRDLRKGQEVPAFGWTENAEKQA